MEEINSTCPGISLVSVIYNILSNILLSMPTPYLGQVNSNHASMPLVSTTRKILSDILLSRLTPYVDEIIGRIKMDSDLISQLLIGYSTLVRYWRKKIVNYVLCKRINRLFQGLL